MNDCVLVALVSVSGMNCVDVRGFTRSDRKHVKAPLAAAIRSMHDLGAQHHSQLVLAVSQF